MNKRLISLLLTFLMVVSMFSCLTVSASAAYDKSNMTAYTMKSGDNVYTVCRRMGIDFYANYDLITNVNGIKNYSAIAPNTVIYLPKLGETYVDNGESSGTGTGSGAGNSGTNASNVTIPASDFVAYYMIPYKMQSGDTVYNVCRGLGISFNSYSEQIKAINGLKSYSNIAVGTTLLLPTSTTPSSTSGAYKVMAHKIVSGETASGIVKSYGMDYNSNVDTLQKLNNKSNLGSIQAGQFLYIAVPASAGGNGGGGNVNPTPSPSPAPANSYAITSAAATNGSFSCQVNGKVVTNAAAGAVVTVVPKANSGCSVNKIMVTKTSNGAAVTVTDGKFTMPNFPVTVSVTFNTGYDIDIPGTPGGETGTLIDGKLRFTASKGELVTITTIADKDYYAASAIVTLRGTSTQVPVSNGTFTMPASDVVVTVKYQKNTGSTTWWLKHVTDSNGDFNTIVNGIPTDMAKEGDTVKVTPMVGSGLEISGISYMRYDNKQTYKLPGKDSFVMPGCDVFLSVTYKTKEAKFVDVNVSAGGSAAVQVGGKNVSSAVPGATVSVAPAAKAGYRVKSVTYTPAGGSAVNITDALSFTMPSKDVTVDVVFETIPTYNINLAYTKAQGAVTAKVSGEAVTKAGAGDLVELDIKPAAGYEVETINVIDVATGKTLKGYTGNTTAFVMPAGEVKVKVTFCGAELAVDTLFTEGGSYYAAQNGKKVTAAESGSTVNVVITPDAGYKVDKAYITYEENGAEAETDISVNFNADKTSTYFTMRPADVLIHVTFVPEDHKVDFSSCGGNVTLAGVTVNGRAITDADNIAAGSTVTVRADSIASGYAYTIKVCKADDSSVVVGTATNGAVSFAMPAYDVVVSLTPTPNKISFSCNGDSGNLTVNSFNVDGNPLPSNGLVNPGAWVVVEPKYYETDWYYVMTVTRDSDGAELAKSTDKPISFAMPGYSITVTVEYKQ